MIMAIGNVLSLKCILAVNQAKSFKLGSGQVLNDFFFCMIEQNSNNISPLFQLVWKYTTSMSANTSQDTESAKSPNGHPARQWCFIFTLHLLTPRTTWPPCAMCGHLSIRPQCSQPQMPTQCQGNHSTETSMKVAVVKAYLWEPLAGWVRAALIWQIFEILGLFSPWCLISVWFYVLLVNILSHVINCSSSYFLLHHTISTYLCIAQQSPDTFLGNITQMSHWVNQLNWLRSIYEDENRYIYF